MIYLSIYLSISIYILKEYLSYAMGYSTDSICIVSGEARITVPVVGVYHISFNTITDSGTGRIDADIRVNGTKVVASLSQNSGSTGYRYRSMSIAVKLQANDYIQFFNNDWYNSTSTGFDQWRKASVTLIA